MNKLNVIAVSLVLAACSKEPNVAVRIDCGDYNDKGLQATLNGQPVGDCPIDIMVHAGEMNVSARKDNEDASYLFAQEKMTLAENAMKRIKLDIQPVYTEEYYYRKATDINGMQAYLEKQPDGKRRQEIVDRIEQYYFDLATDIAGMQTYLKKQPDGKRRNEVTDMLEQYYFDKATDIAGMQAYLENQPNGKRRGNIIDKLEQYYFDKATNIHGMQAYLEKQPDGKRRSQITDKLEQSYFDKATDIAGIQAYLEKQPYGKRRSQITDKLEQYYFDKATDIPGMKAYIEKQPNGKRKTDIEQRLKKTIRAKLESLAPNFVMVQIPAGSFMMGCSEGDTDCWDDEKPMHQVNISAFALSKTEVTFAQYDVFAKTTKRKLPKDEGWGRGNRPVINVSWQDAVAYVKWLSEQTGQKFRLPSEAEWEYAVRAGSTSKYSWGNNLGNNNASCDSCGNNRDNKQTMPVASFAANAFGLHDMHGNVWEWVQDCWNNSYNNAPDNGAAWQSGNCELRVMRGGSWVNGALNLRSSARFKNEMDKRLHYYGFRVAQDL